MRQPEQVTVTPKYRPGQVVKYRKWFEHAPEDRTRWPIRYEAIRKVEASIKWENGVSTVRIYYDLAAAIHGVNENDIIEVVTEESSKIRQEGDKDGS